MRVDGGVAATVEPRLAASLTEAADGPEPRKHAARDAGCRALSDGGRGTGLVLLRWRDSDAPTEATVGRRLREEGVVPYAWSNGPGDRYAGHDHGYDKVLMCAAGSIVFRVGPAAEPIELEAGDGFVLPAGTRHSADVGPLGCTCLEGRR